MRASHLAVFLPATMALGASAIEAPIPGYGVYVPEWEVQATPDGPTVLLSGTVEEVVDQLQELNPEYEELLNTTIAQSAALDKRTDFSGSKVVCGNFPKANRDRLYAGVGYLRGVGGRPWNAAGPGTCGRVSCSWNSAIWWCNDAKSRKTLDSYSSIADGATRALSVCKGNPLVSGQAFHKTNWNVIVRRASC
ncbi:hypothetical protein K4K54_009529 [Colletotrichum sp. SAR 10_86]|nr:hypothetical protein K4K54_009529 [Colletotrichum sp. SAR 10_86]